MVSLRSGSPDITGEICILGGRASRGYLGNPSGQKNFGKRVEPDEVDMDSLPVGMKEGGI